MKTLLRAPWVAAILPLLSQAAPATLLNVASDVTRGFYQELSPFDHGGTFAEIHQP